MRSWCSWGTFSGRTATPTGRFAGYPQPSPSPRVAQPNEKPDSVAFLPYVGSIFNRISRVLSQQNITSMGLPPRNISSFLRSAKDDLGLKTLVSAVRSTLGRRTVRHQFEGAPATCQSRTSGQVSRGGGQSQLGAPHPVTPHRHPLYQTQTHGSDHQGGE
jgi:hypothetical protein